jgi:hypothetical protein
MGDKRRAGGCWSGSKLANDGLASEKMMFRHRHR